VRRSRRCWPGAAALLDATAVLDPVVRQRVLAEAAGNPLALVELPVTAGQHDSRGALNGRIPLTRRLERAFASRLPGLPAVTRTALLAAGLNDGDTLAEVLAAASVVAGVPVSVADLADAVAAGLAEVAGHSVRFRHPLVRSAVCEAAGPARRLAMHRALAQVLAGVPDRHVWHRAAASLGPDEEVAASLGAAADRAFRRGAIAEQAAALAQAARLSPSSAQRGQRLIRAAWAFHDLGRRQTVLRLLDEAEALDLEPGDRLRLARRRGYQPPGFPSRRWGGHMISASIESGRAASHRLYVGARRRSRPHQPHIRRPVRPAVPDHPGRIARGSP
jgi:hypothetical protein